MKQSSFIAKLLSEFLGTLFLTLTISLSVQASAVSSGSSLHPALVIGLVLTSLIFTFGHISQAHFNPVVTICLAFFFPNMKHPLMPKTTAFAYIIVQVLASIVGGSLGIYLSPFQIAEGRDDDPTALKKTQSMPFAKPMSDSATAIGKAFVAEFIWTFLMMIVILNVGFSKNQQGNQFFAFAIGMIVTGGAICVGPVSGAAFNPAVGTGLCITMCFLDRCGVASKFLWVYWIACPLGGIAAVFVNRILWMMEEDTSQSQQSISPDETITSSSSAKEMQNIHVVVECKNSCDNDNDDVDHDDESDTTTMLTRRRQKVSGKVCDPGHPDLQQDNKCGDEDCPEETYFVVKPTASSSSSSKSKSSSSCKNKVCDVPGLGKVTILGEGSGKKE